MTTKILRPGVKTNAAKTHEANPELAARWRRATEEPAWVRWTLIGIALTFLFLFLVLPLAVVLYGAFEQGVGVWFAAINEPDALAAIRLSLLVVVIVVPINMVFGVAAAWAIAKHEFRGKPDFADRHALCYLTGGGGADLRHFVRLARLARAMARG